MYLRLLLLLSLFLLASCTHKAPVNLITTQNSTQRLINIHDASRIKIDGAINVSLHTGYKKPLLILRGDSRALQYVSVTLQGNTLIIAQSQPAKYGIIHAEIRGHILTSFEYKGMGNIEGHKIHASRLDLNIQNNGKTSLSGYLALNNLTVAGKGVTLLNGVDSRYLKIHLVGNPRVQLSGVANLSEVTLDGKGWLSMYWVKSNTLTLRSHGAVQSQFAGIVNKLDVELWDKAQFKGRYLRAKSSFVKTHDHAKAEITTLNRQHTLALDASDIYFYKESKYQGAFMGNNGAVLDFERLH